MRKTLVATQLKWRNSIWDVFCPQYCHKIIDLLHHWGDDIYEVPITESVLKLYYHIFRLDILKVYSIRPRNEFSILIYFLYLDWKIEFRQFLSARIFWPGNIFFGRPKKILRANSIQSGTTCKLKLFVNFKFTKLSVLFLALPCKHLKFDKFTSLTYWNELSHDYIIGFQLRFLQPLVFTTRYKLNVSTSSVRTFSWIQLC